jgi:hypothetical protein
MKKGKGDKNYANNAIKGKNEKRKVKFPFKLCMDDHLNHLFPHLTEAQKLLAQQEHLVLKNPFPQGKNMAQASTSMSMNGGSQVPPIPHPSNLATNIYMMNAEAHLSNRICDYKTMESIEKGKEASNPLNPIQIENTVGETITCIPKGAFKRDYHNPNMRAAQN